MPVIVTLKVAGTGPQESAGTGPSPPEELRRVVRSAGASIRPLHPGSADASLASYFVVDLRDAERVDTLIRLLLQSPLVDAAYAKPRDALP